MEARLKADRSELSGVLTERHELFRETSALVVDLALSWADTEPATVPLVVHPPLTRVDVQMVFDEISEQYHVTGIGIHFDEEEDGRIRAVFTSNFRRPTGVLRTEFQE